MRVANRSGRKPSSPSPQGSAASSGTTYPGPPSSRCCPPHRRRHGATQCSAQNLTPRQLPASHSTSPPSSPNPTSSGWPPVMADEPRGSGLCSPVNSRSCVTLPRNASSTTASRRVPSPLRRRSGATSATASKAPSTSTIWRSPAQTAPVSLSRSHRRWTALVGCPVRAAWQPTTGAGDTGTGPVMAHARGDRLRHRRALISDRRSLIAADQCVISYRFGGVGGLAFCG